MEGLLVPYKYEKLVFSTVTGKPRTGTLSTAKQIRKIQKLTKETTKAAAERGCFVLIRMPPTSCSLLVRRLVFRLLQPWLPLATHWLEWPATL